MKNLLKSFITSLFLMMALLTVSQVQAQQSLTSITGWNAYVHLPASYATSGVSYPTIIFFPGLGEVGTDPNKVIQYGPGAYIAQGWNGNVIANGNTVEFIVISLQTASAFPSEYRINQAIQSIKSLYRIDNNKLYLTGLSHGGWCSSTFVTGDAYGGPYTYASQVAAVVTVEGMRPDDNSPYPNLFDNFANTGGRYLGFEQSLDNRDTKTVADRMNATRPNSGIYVQTSFGGGGHCCWEQFYGGGGVSPVNFNLDGVSQNIYVWMAKQSLGTTPPLPPPTNVLPIANAGTDKILTLPVNSTTLTGTGTDADGTIASYTWNKISGPSAIIANAGSASTLISGLLQGVYIFELKVTDNNGGINTDQVQVTVNASVVMNLPPVANAGSDITITLPANAATLSGSGTDPDGNIVSYSWTLYYGPNMAPLSNANAATTTIGNLLQGSYDIDLTVTDNSGATATDRMVLIVNTAITIPNIPPTANAGADLIITLPTNSISATGIGTDPDGSVNGYFWTKISGPATGNINNANASTATFIGLVQGIYVYQLQVTDNNGAIATDNMQVIVNPGTVATPGNIPPLVNAGPDIYIAGATYVGLNGSGYDPDGYMVGWQWRKINGPFSEPINNPSTANAGAGGLVTGTYTFEIQGTDNNNGITKDTMLVFVNTSTTLSPNQLPVANAGLNIVITLPTNIATLVGGGTDNDGSITSFSWTKISGPAMSFANASSSITVISGLVQGNYIFQLLVTDNSGGTATAQVQVTVNPATLTNQLPVANAGANITITLPASSATLSGSGADADGSIVSYGWTKISGSAMTFANASSATTGISGLVQGVYVFQLLVTDNSGATASAQVQVFVNDAPITIINKSVKVNLYDGIAPYNNSQWNNWFSTNNISSSNFLYSDGTISTINANLNSQDRLADNGSNYASASTFVPPAVLRFNSAQTSNRTLTISGLNPSKQYSFEFYASRANSGNKTVYTIGTVNDTINTDNNVSDFAKFINVSPDYSGNVIVTLSRIGTWQYIAGFMITEGNVAGRSAAIAVITQPTISDATGPIKENSLETIADNKNATVKVFPNPFMNTVQVALGTNITGKYTLNIINVSGKVLIAKNGEKNMVSKTETLDASGLTYGIYFLEVISGGKRSVHKLKKILPTQY